MKVERSRECKCKKTKCLKKYCECYNSGVKCGKFCKCDNCHNCESPDNWKQMFFNLMIIFIHIWTNHYVCKSIIIMGHFGRYINWHKRLNDVVSPKNLQPQEKGHHKSHWCAAYCHYIFTHSLYICFYHIQIYDGWVNTSQREDYQSCPNPSWKSKYIQEL